MDSFPSPCQCCFCRRDFFWGAVAFSVSYSGCTPSQAATTFLGPPNSACVARQITGHPEGRGVCIAPPPPAPALCRGSGGH